MRRALAAIACGGLLAAAVLASADAPKDQYDVFDSTADTIFDQRTHLAWQRFPEGIEGGAPTGETLASAQSRCNAAGPGRRLPSVKELLTLVDEDPHRIYDDGGISYRWIDRNAFPTTVQAPYWSSSRVTGGSGDGKAWAVNFASGLPTIESPGTLLYARCVQTF